jgi:hypothetical protein
MFRLEDEIGIGTRRSRGSLVLNRNFQFLRDGSETLDY